jgi:hypothetical protein
MLWNYLLAFLLTIIIEGGVVFLMGFRTRRHMLAVLMVNLVTHPALNYIILVLYNLGVAVTTALILALEGLVVIVEGLLFIYMFEKPKGRLFLTAFLMNAASYLIGLVIF